MRECADPGSIVYEIVRREGEVLVGRSGRVDSLWRVGIVQWPSFTCFVDVGYANRQIDRLTSQQKRFTNSGKRSLSRIPFPSRLSSSERHPECRTVEDMHPELAYGGFEVFRVG
jgi:hypothetical protein